MFPNLKSLDFAKVTDDEKDAARLHIIVNNTNVKKHSLWNAKFQIFGIIVNLFDYEYLTDRCTQSIHPACKTFYHSIEEEETN